MSNMKFHAPWYDKLTVEEAREIDMLDNILRNLKAAVTAASKRRTVIQNRAQMRKGVKS